MSRREGETEFHCNWPVYSKAVHTILKEIPTIGADGLELTKGDYRWAYAVRRLKNTVLEPSGADRGYHFFDDDLANQLIESEMQRRKNNNLTP